MPAPVHRATEPAAPKSTSSGWAVTTRVRSTSASDSIRGNVPGRAAILAAMGALSTSHWPADTSVPVLDVTVGGLLRDAAGDAPDRPALVAGVHDVAARRRWTYAELLDDAERTARALLQRFEPGER